jgi:hypothetical protein
VDSAVGLPCVNRQLAAFDPPEVDGVLAAGVEEELSFDDDDDDPLEEPLDDPALSDAEEDLRLSVR